MFKQPLIFVFLVFLISCKSKPASLGGDEKVELQDFLDAFPGLATPTKIADTSIAKKKDTTTISYAVFSEFIPDTVMEKVAGKTGVKTIIQPFGKIATENELYLLADFTRDKTTTLEVFVLDKKNEYQSAFELMKNNNKDNYHYSVSITSEPTFIKGKEKTNAEGTLFYTKTGYAFDKNAHDFIAVMNDSNEDLKRNNAIINPIDTFAGNNKYSGDYSEDKRNFISLRDGGSSNKYSFFIHFEKNDGKCTGELKGIMTMRDATHFYYRQSGDPCIIDFTFKGKTIIIKEQNNCGNHRGIECYFDDRFTKRKEYLSAEKKS